MKNNQTDVPLSLYKARYRDLSPQEICSRTSLPFSEETQRFALTLLGTPLSIDWPHFMLHGTKGCFDSAATKILMIRYLLEGRDAPSTGRFLSYRELPWGPVYNENFQKRCIKRLSYAFGTKLEFFSQACLSLGGIPLNGADAAYELPFLETLHLRLLLWADDEEFPPSAQILFSDNFVIAFSAEDIAAIGDLVIGRLQELATPCQKR